MKLALLFNQCILELQQVPDFFTKGIIYLKPKDENTENPSKYRSIMCLLTIYKMLTSIISDKLNSHLKTKQKQKNRKAVKETVKVVRNRSLLILS
jgi:hypothetical protein